MNAKVQLISMCGALALSAACNQSSRAGASDRDEATGTTPANAYGAGTDTRHPSDPANIPGGAPAQQAPNPNENGNLGRSSGTTAPTGTPPSTDEQGPGATGATGVAGSGTTAGATGSGATGQGDTGAANTSGAERAGAGGSGGTGTGTGTTTTPP